MAEAQPGGRHPVGADGVGWHRHLGRRGPALLLPSGIAAALQRLGDALWNRGRDDAAVPATVVDEGDKGSGADGLESDDRGRIYITAYEHDAILRRLPDGSLETVVHDPRLLWPDTLSLAVDGYLYVTANQLHRQAMYQGGRDLRQRPYTLFRVPVDATPVRLR
ncbi:MAG: hypothetical protein QOJ19_4558 [Acidimicrobiia bacterium]|nr:hypothetical protein [Acidimicrobiia bacterium]